MRLLIAILLVLPVAQKTYPQCSDRVNGFGVNARYFVNEYADAINLNATYNFKKHSFQMGPFLSFYQITKIQIFASRTTSDLYSGLNFGYGFFPNIQLQTLDFFFFYNTQIGPSWSELFKRFYSIDQTVGYGFNIYLGKNKKVYLTHLLGFGHALHRENATDWRTNASYIQNRQTWTVLLALGIGFTEFSNSVKKEEKQ